MKWFVLLLAFSFAGVQAEVYKYTNKQGKTSYSDIPVVGAKKVIVPPVMTYKAPVAASTIRTPKPNIKESYQHLAITQPKDQATIRSNQGAFTVKYAIQPELQVGDYVVLTVDGVRQQGLSVEGLARGEHRLLLTVLDANNEVQIDSAPRLIYLHHASKL